MALIAGAIKTENGDLGFDEVVNKSAESIQNLVTNPKMGPFTLGAIQNGAAAASANYSKPGEIGNRQRDEKAAAE